MPVRRGDVIRISSQGGGGWGDPLERSLETVLDDVRNGKVSGQIARDIDGAVIHGDAVDVAASREARDRLAGVRVYLRPVRVEGLARDWGVRVIRVGARGAVRRRTATSWRSSSASSRIRSAQSCGSTPRRRKMRCCSILKRGKTWRDPQSRLLFRRVDT